MRESGRKDVAYVPRKEALTDELLKVVKSGDMVITLGAGDIWKVGESLLSTLRRGERGLG